MNRFFKKRFIPLIILLLCGYSSPSFAEPIYKANVHVDLVAEVAGIIPGETFWAGMQMTMDDDWHIYWRNPGDSGYATKIEWDLPEGFEAGDTQWPYPKRIDYDNGITSYGYEGEVILLTEIKVPANINDGSQQNIKAKTTWLSCKKICIPGTAELSIVLPVQENKVSIRDDIRQRFNKERQRWPVLESSWRVSVLDKGDDFLFKIFPSRPVPYQITQMAFFPYRNDMVDHAGKQILKKDEHGYELVIPKADLFDQNISNIQGVLVSPEGWQKEGEGRGLYLDTQIVFKNEKEKK